MPRSPANPTPAASAAAAAAAAPPPEAVDMESDFVVILAVLLCALICAVGLVAVARCAWLRRYPPASAAAAASRPPPAANKGLKKKALQSLPKIVYGTGEAGAAAAAAAAAAAGRLPVECAICLAEFAEGDEVRLLPQCGHGFHVGCIDPWLGSHSSCPSCRQVLVVARCQKCGQFPAVPAAGAEVQLKAREDGGNSNSFLP